MGFRATAMSVAEMADTWADAETRSPYADLEPEAARLGKTGANDADTGSRTVVMSEPPPEDSLTIDVDVALEPTPPPPAAGRPAPQLARSGIRSSDAPSEDFAEDAPQFFDRKSLETLGSPSGPPPASGPTPSSGPNYGAAMAPGSGPRSADLIVDSRTAITGRTDRRALLAAQSAAGAEAPRFPLAWMALAFIALGLVVVVALALR
jgi:hypothetical protein